MPTMTTLLSAEELTKMAKDLFAEEHSKKRLDGWLRIKQIQKECDEKFAELPRELRAAKTLKEVALKLPISISNYAIFAGTQDDAFSSSYALINPSFKVEEFSGYCDPTAIFNDITPGEGITQQDIEDMREYCNTTEYVKSLADVYSQYRKYTNEVVFFVEQVTGHIIPDMKPALSFGVLKVIDEIDKKLSETKDETVRINYESMKTSLEAVLILAKRYADEAERMMATADDKRKQQLEIMRQTLLKVPAHGADNLYEAIQSFLMLWQIMCIEQAPNPYAFSVGNADRIFEPYRAKDNLSRDEAAALFKHMLVFYNVADRSWAISQNILVGGKSGSGKDLTNETSFAIFDAYYDMNLPQPILSVKLHKDTPDSIYESMGRFFFTPGCLTPSLFNDDALFKVLENAGVEYDDIENYAIAGCQEPLIMGKDNGNTTNSWLNMGKILELSLNNGVSTISGETIGPVDDITDPKERLKHIREIFYRNLDFYVKKMAEAANGASKVVSLLPVPFLSTFMGGIESGYDMRDTEHQGTKYNGSGCLIHGLSVVADSFVAIDRLLSERPQDAGRLIKDLQNDFKDDEELRQYLKSCPKYGNNIELVDKEAAEIASRVADTVSAQKNYLGNPFRPDFSTPSTHLLYGYWVGATPDGRKARGELNYGIDPLFGDATSGLGFRTLSYFRLPFIKMPAGCALHFGIDPKYFKGETFEQKGKEFKSRVLAPLFFNPGNKNIAPFYLYVNVTTPDILRMVKENPKKYAPSGVYIVRIHGTFVNFLDLSPDIQDDIIKRLDLKSTAV